jgi:HSP20 family protein
MSESVPIRKSSSILDRMSEMQDRVMRRAFELFEQNGSQLGHDLDDWFQAERELTWRPPFELSEKNGQFQLEAAISGVEAKDIDIEVTPEDIILRAETQHTHSDQKGAIHYCEFQSGKMFRSIRLPKRIDPDRVRAEFKNGLLRLTAPIAEQALAKKMKPEAA